MNARQKDQNGISHIILPIAVLVMIGVIGAALLVGSHADAPTHRYNVINETQAHASSVDTSKWGKVTYDRKFQGFTIDDAIKVGLHTTPMPSVAMKPTPPPCQVIADGTISDHERTTTWLCKPGVWYLVPDTFNDRRTPIHKAASAQLTNYAKRVTIRKNRPVTVKAVISKTAIKPAR